jgi:hypothetical protein
MMRLKTHSSVAKVLASSAGADEPIPPHVKAALLTVEGPSFATRPRVAIDVENRLALDFSPDSRQMAYAIALATAFFLAAVLVSVLRRGTSSRPGCLIWILLGLSALCLLMAWEAYSPSCPRGWWC